MATYSAKSHVKAMLAIEPMGDFVQFVGSKFSVTKKEDVDFASTYSEDEPLSGEVNDINSQNLLVSFRDSLFSKSLILNCPTNAVLQDSVRRISNSRRSLHGLPYTRRTFW